MIIVMKAIIKGIIGKMTIIGNLIQEISMAPIQIIMMQIIQEHTLVMVR